MMLRVACHHAVRVRVRSWRCGVARGGPWLGRGWPARWPGLAGLHSCFAGAPITDAGAVGDVDGDGLADIIVGASGSDVTDIDSGRAYVVFGVRTLPD